MRVHAPALDAFLIALSFVRQHMTAFQNVAHRPRTPRRTLVEPLWHVTCAIEVPRRWALSEGWGKDIEHGEGEGEYSTAQVSLPSLQSRLLTFPLPCPSLSPRPPSSRHQQTPSCARDRRYSPVTTLRAKSLARRAEARAVPGPHNTTESSVARQGKGADRTARRVRVRSSACKTCQHDHSPPCPHAAPGQLAAANRLRAIAHAQPPVSVT
ncbi:hypothetical protein POSPLADRAFT_1062979 [Postia placenta MAD-698-R-SB12]|uniref:Uncharacterized protein n=1 Tax=Postia placenta MAD-698-R-SB12 TaxID=670580 RepID=A0A1X6MIW2_9APHY|nr:hypothetical protein POSPLADRAFT_1062979 [Postia placenta MAD-698-R-SB12]OSX56092.1 hypothetical protein POSPLADRAFT_1062979 [Postia placenta MAD-698-R-SB12]